MAGGGFEALRVLVNAGAGRRSVPVERLHDALSAEGRRSDILILPAHELPAAAREAARGGRVVAVAGGDGTLSGAAAAIAEVGGVLAPFPLGTRNHFARRLGISSPEAAARAVAIGRVVQVPLGSVDGRVFINHASAGLYPRLVYHRQRVMRWTGKSAGTVLAGLYVLSRLNAITVALEMEDSRRELVVPGLWIALGRGAFRLPVDGHAPSGRNLEILIPTTGSRLLFVRSGVRSLWRIRRGKAIEGAGVEVIHTPAFTLDARHPIDISRDGEVERMKPPIEFRMHPHALRVFSLVSGPREQAVA